MNIDVQFHAIELKADYRKPRITTDSTTFVNLMTNLVQLPFHKFGKRGTGSKPHYTHSGLIDLEFFRKPEETLELDRIVFHGEYFRPNDPNPARILAEAAKFNFYTQRIDLKFDLSADFVPYDVIHEHFRNDLVTSTAGYTPWTSPEGARLWYAGLKRPQGYRISFYEAGKIHTGLPAGAHRIEVQLSGLDAQKFAHGYLTTPTNNYMQQFMLYLLDKRISFREPSADTNKARWPVCQWWLDITAGAGNFSEHVTVARKALDSNKVKWLHQTLTAHYDRLGLDLFAQALGKLLMDKRQVLTEVYNLHAELDPAIAF